VGEWHSKERVDGPRSAPAGGKQRILDGVTEPDVGEVLLGLVAVAALVKIVVPPLMFRMGLLRLRIRVDDDPASAEPRGDDPSFRERFEQFRALGFRPLGTTYETCWFITPYDWLWRSRPIRWMAAPDGRTLASFHRLTAEEPLRFSAATILEGGAMVRTTCPGTGSHPMPVVEHYRRVQLTAVDPVDLVSRHQAEVAAFSTERGQGVVAATLRQAADTEAAIERLILPRLNQANAEQTIKVTFGGTAALTLLIRAFSRGTPAWSDFAIAILIGAAVCEATVRFVVRRNFRTLVAASHTASSGPPPVSDTGRDIGQPEPVAGGGLSKAARTALLWVSTVFFFVVFWQILNHRGR
jgi:hypothetical protein